MRLSTRPIRLENHKCCRHLASSLTLEMDVTYYLGSAYILTTQQLVVRIYVMCDCKFVSMFAFPSYGFDPELVRQMTPGCLNPTCYQLALNFE